MSSNTFFLVPLPAFRLDLTVWTLRRRHACVYRAGPGAQRRFGAQRIP
jgi:hypothetical protein